MINHFPLASYENQLYFLKKYEYFFYQLKQYNNANIIRQSSGSRQAVVRQFSRSFQAVIRVIRKLSGSHQAVIRISQPRDFQSCLFLKLLADKNGLKYDFILYLSYFIFRFMHLQILKSVPIATKFSRPQFIWLHISVHYIKSTHVIYVVL